MTGAPVRPIQIDNRWRDSDANTLMKVSGRDLSTLLTMQRFFVAGAVLP
jgi:hypothetical protein